MKTITAMCAGLLLSALTFLIGVGITLTFLNIDEPVHRLDTNNSKILWSTTPVVVDKANQVYERVPAAKREITALENVATEVKLPVKTVSAQLNDAIIDPVTTSSILVHETDEDAEIRRERAIAHTEWCSRRYRSYDDESDTYRPFGGERRTCQSPYAENTAKPSDDETVDVGATEPEGQFQEFNETGVVEKTAFSDVENARADSDHVQSCRRRYRSYRPADNSYKPYGSSQRRQCI